MNHSLLVAYPVRGTGLAAHEAARQPGVLDAGRLTAIFDRAAAGESCGCGHLLLECPVWAPGVRAVMTPTTAGLRAAARLTVAVECDPTVRRTDVVRYAELWRGLLFASAAAARASAVLDRSSSPWQGAGRARRLRSIVGLRLRPLGSGSVHVAGLANDVANECGDPAALSRSAHHVAL